MAPASALAALAAAAAAGLAAAAPFNLNNHNGFGSNPAPTGLTTSSINVNGIFPSLTMTAESGPVRSECGHGAMIAWNDRCD